MSEPIRDFGFMRRPKWVVGHLIVIVFVTVFVLMGSWQLRRLADRQEFNTLLVERTSEAVRPLDDVLAEYGPSQDALELRFVVATGRYAADQEIILLARSYNGLSGHHVLTPLYLDDGRAVIVDRGWVPIDLDQPGLTEFAPPASDAEVYGVLRKTEVRGMFGPTEPEDGVIAQTARVDLERIGQQLEADLVPVYIQLQKQNPAPKSDLPALVPLPIPSEGSHRGYAVQWFLFAGVTLIGYPILLWRTAEGG